MNDVTPTLSKCRPAVRLSYDLSEIESVLATFGHLEDDAREAVNAIYLKALRCVFVNSDFHVFHSSEKSGFFVVTFKITKNTFSPYRVVYSPDGKPIGIVDGITFEVSERSGASSILPVTSIGCAICFAPSFDAGSGRYFSQNVNGGGAVIGSHAGKGRAAISLNELRYGGSVLAINPKGELAPLTARVRAEKLRRSFWVPNPFGATDRKLDEYEAGFSPFAMRRWFFAESAALTAGALVVTGWGDPNRNGAARDFVGVALHLFAINLALLTVDRTPGQPATKAMVLVVIDGFAALGRLPKAEDTTAQSVRHLAIVLIVLEPNDMDASRSAFSSKLGRLEERYIVDENCPVLCTHKGHPFGHITYNGRTRLSQDERIKACGRSWHGSHKTMFSSADQTLYISDIDDSLYGMYVSAPSDITQGGSVQQNIVH